MEQHSVDIFYGGSFLNEKNDGGLVYMEGCKHEMAIDVSTFVLSGLLSAIQVLLGNKKCGKVHFRKPKKPICTGLMLLCEGTIDKFTELLKKYKKIELYVEHQVRDRLLHIRSENVVVEGLNIGVSDQEKAIDGRGSQQSLVEEINTILGNLNNVQVEEVISDDILGSITDDVLRGE